MSEMLSRKTLQFSLGVSEQLLGECSDQAVVWATQESVIDSREVLLIFPVSNNIQTGAGTHQPSCKMDTGDYVLVRRKADHKILLTAEVKNAWSLPPFPHTKYRGKFTSFTFIRIPAMHSTNFIA